MSSLYIVMDRDGMTHSMSLIVVWEPNLFGMLELVRTSPPDRLVVICAPRPPRS